MDARPNILLLQSDEHLTVSSARGGGNPAAPPASMRSYDRNALFAGLLSNASVLPKSDCHCWSPLPSLRRLRCARYCLRSYPRLPMLWATQAMRPARWVRCTRCVRQWAGFQARPYGDFGGPCPPVRSPAPIQRCANPGMDSAQRQPMPAWSIPESLLQEQMVARESLAWLREQRLRHPSSLASTHLLVDLIPPYGPSAIYRSLRSRTHNASALNEAVTARSPHDDRGDKGFRCDEIGEQEMMNARAAYFACVDFLDEMIGDFLASCSGWAIGQYDYRLHLRPRRNGGEHDVRKTPGEAGRVRLSSPPRLSAAAPAARESPPPLAWPTSFPRLRTRRHPPRGLMESI